MEHDESTGNTEETTTEHRMIELPNFSYSPEVQAKMVERYKALRWQLETLDLFAPSTQEAHEDAKGNLQVEAAGLLDFALSMAAEVQKEREAREAAERDLALEQRAHALSVEQRDRAEDAADRLAYALYSVEEIGEHTNLNDPWANAAERLESLAQAGDQA